MSFAKIVVLAMLSAFAVGAGLSIQEGRETAHSQLAQVPKPMTQSAGNTKFRPYTLCSGATRFHCVVDGDTLWHEGVKVRIADIDAPEISTPKCQSEAALGSRSTKRLLQLVNQGPFEMLSWQSRDEDKYGRKLRILVRNGKSIGDILVSEGLARTWSGRRQPWC